MDRSVRLDGWKEIARYMKRDRSTVIRWKTYGIPVHSVPGSRAGSVYAFADELDAWLAKGGAPVPVESVVPSSLSQLRVKSLATTWWKIAAAAALAIAALVAVAALVLKEAPPKMVAAQVKLDPATERVYVQARVDWAKRTPDGLRRAIDELDTVIRRQPRVYRRLCGARGCVSALARVWRDAPGRCLRRTPSWRHVMLLPLTRIPQAPTGRWGSSRIGGGRTTLPHGDISCGRSTSRRQARRRTSGTATH